jgi:hypothetical protein
MTRDDIIRLAQEAKAWQLPHLIDHDGLERFAALVATTEKQKVVEYMNSRAFATGHGDTIEDLLKEMEWQVAEREREACAKVVEEKAAQYKERAAKSEKVRDINPEIAKNFGLVAKIAILSCGHAIAAIRARGKP